MPVINPEALVAERVAAIKAYHAASGITRAELDLSGGIDSAVMLGLLALALGPDNVTTVYSSINSSASSAALAEECAAAFGVRFVSVELGDIYANLIDAMKASLVAGGYDAAEIDARIANDPTILGSIRSCIRAPIGRGYNRLTGGGIRHGTGNECEDRWTRFFQKGGDGEVDTNPIAMLSKGETYQLAKALGVPDSILKAKPTPDLWGSGDAHNDEDEFASWMGFTPPEGITFYSYINADSGEYVCVGLIERVARFIDSGLRLEEALFGDGNLEDLTVAAIDSGLFVGLSDEQVGDFLTIARRIERITRHKENPNCPCLGSRADMLAAGILTDTLPL